MKKRGFASGAGTAHGARVGPGKTFARLYLVNFSFTLSRSYTQLSRKFRETFGCQGKFCAHTCARVLQLQGACEAPERWAQSAQARGSAREASKHLSFPPTHTKSRRIVELYTQNCGFSSHLGSCNGQYGTPKGDPLTLGPYLSRNFFALRAA